MGVGGGIGTRGKSTSANTTLTGSEIFPNCLFENHFLVMFFPPSPDQANWGDTSLFH